jgi:hypothetical protein
LNTDSEHGHIVERKLSRVSTDPQTAVFPEIQTFLRSRNLTTQKKVKATATKDKSNPQWLANSYCAVSDEPPSRGASKLSLMPHPSAWVGSQIASYASKTPVYQRSTSIQFPPQLARYRLTRSGRGCPPS